VRSNRGGELLSLGSSCLLNLLSCGGNLMPTGSNLWGPLSPLSADFVNEKSGILDREKAGAPGLP
ncbi:MAG TPA: hypothetical protein VGA17_06485, partial [Nitrospiraceae bacterium]